MYVLPITTRSKENK